MMINRYSMEISQCDSYIRCNCNWDR